MERTLRLIPRQGDGPDERPDNHNIACHAAIVAQTDSSVTVHWRYAPDITKPSFTDFRAAYNEAGNPAPFYAEYADEYFTIHADGKVVRTVKNGCYRLDDWNEPRNQIEQTLELMPDGIRETAFRPAQLSKASERPVIGAPLKSGRTDNLVRHWRFDEGAGFATTEKQAGKACEIGVNDWDQLKGDTGRRQIAQFGGIGVDVDQSWLRPGTWGYLEVVGAPLSVSDEDALPTEFRLYHNYPNPFNPATIIRYDLKEDVDVTVKVYSTLGQEVATLVNEHQKAGRYSVNFNASRLASGMYVYTIRAGSYVATHKMMFMK